MDTQQIPVEFPSNGTTCRGRHFLPAVDTLQDAGGIPCVVIGHGFGGTADAGLEPYARKFASAGLHALVFDYRYFGNSDGTPRQLLSVRRQHEDWRAAIACARALEGVDRSRVALFGTSFSGGHVIEVAVQDGDVAAVVAQCPMMDGLAAMQNLLRYAGVGQLLRMTWTGVCDLGRAMVGRAPRMIAIIGPPGTLAVMTSPDAEPGFRAIAPPDFRNEVCARVCLTVGGYRPGRKTNRLPCPVLVCVCEKDSVAPVDVAIAAVSCAGHRGELKRYPVGHFEIYTGENFERATADQVEFLTRTLAPCPRSPQMTPTPQLGGSSI